MKIIVSACLLGKDCKYNGGSNRCQGVLDFVKSHEVIPVCPEVLGGLSTPRLPAEIKNGTVTNAEGYSVDAEFRKGAKMALDIALKEGAELAILQPRSPSCGCKQVYDGTFNRTLKSGKGVFAQLLHDNGIKTIEPTDILNNADFTVKTADCNHHKYIPDILEAIYDASKVKGNSIVMRDPAYLAKKMDEGKAVIATQGDKFAGFCYIESWESERFIANSGLIVKPEYRGLGLASRIKKTIFDICRTMFPDAKIFSITKSQAVIKMNTRLGFMEVPYSELTVDPKFWKGCDTCPHYQTLLDNGMQNCECHGLLYIPAKSPTST